MPATIRRDCPHCRTRNQSFELEHAYVIGPSNIGKVGAKRVAATFMCGYCKRPIIVCYEPVTDTDDFSPRSVLTLDGRYSSRQQWPVSARPHAPEHTPDHIARLYCQALDNIALEHWDSAGMALRKVLEMSVNEIGAKEINEEEWLGIRAKKLAARMRELANRHLLTPGLADWADELRESGNEANHEDEPYTKEEALLMRDIAELLLIYLFKLPKTLKLRRAERSAAATSKAS